MRLRDLGLALLTIALLVAGYESGQVMFVVGAAAVVGVAIALRYVHH